MAKKKPVCERCKRPERNVGPWDGTGGYRMLCGGCKCEVTLALPGVKERLQRELDAAGALLSKEKKLWIWYWQGGGYNSTKAETREEALVAARAMETKYLKMAEDTLHVGTREELERLDREYASLFN